MTRIIYLHGFASSPESTKAQFFRSRFEQRGAQVDIPRLDENDFKSLTVTRQLKVIEGLAGNDRAILMGSSLGGYLAALYASQHPAIEKLVLMAPAFEFPSRWRAHFSPAEFDAWERTGSKTFFHYGARQESELGYGFVEDAMHYPDRPEFAQPALILHGNFDEVVPVSISESYSAEHPNVTLRTFDAGHELTNVMEDLWAETAGFLFAESAFQTP
jgi:pimeloyl-ACP methyl ester carboxylesterase